MAILGTFVTVALWLWQGLPTPPPARPKVSKFRALCHNLSRGTKRRPAVGHVDRSETCHNEGKTLIPDLRFLMFIGPHPHSWQGEVDYLRTWTHKRAAWIDAHIGEL